MLWRQVVHRGTTTDQVRVADPAGYVPNRTTEKKTGSGADLQVKSIQDPTSGFIDQNYRTKSINLVNKYCKLGIFDLDAKTDSGFDPSEHPNPHPNSSFFEIRIRIRPGSTNMVKIQSGGAEQTYKSNKK